MPGGRGALCRGGGVMVTPGKRNSLERVLPFSRWRPTFSMYPSCSSATNARETVRSSRPVSSARRRIEGSHRSVSLLHRSARATRTNLRVAGRFWRNAQPTCSELMVGVTSPCVGERTSPYRDSGGATRPPVPPQVHGGLVRCVGRAHEFTRRQEAGRARYDRIVHARPTLQSLRLMRPTAPYVREAGIIVTARLVQKGRSSFTRCATITIETSSMVPAHQSLMLPSPLPRQPPRPGPPPGSRAPARPA